MSTGIAGSALRRPQGYDAPGRPGVNIFTCPSSANIPNPTYDSSSYTNNLGNNPGFNGRTFDGPAYYIGGVDNTSRSPKR